MSRLNLVLTYGIPPELNLVLPRRIYLQGRFIFTGCYSIIRSNNDYYTYYMLGRVHVSMYVSCKVITFNSRVLWINRVANFARG